MRHGYYTRKTPYGPVPIARYVCRKLGENGRTISLLPQFFASRMPGELQELEDQTVAAEEQGVWQSAEDVHPSRRITRSAAYKWLRSRMTALYAVLKKILGILTDLFTGCAAKVISMRAALGTESLLVELRRKLEDHLQDVPHPIGYRPPDPKAPDPKKSVTHEPPGDKIPRVEHRIVHRHWKVLLGDNDAGKGQEEVI